MLNTKSPLTKALNKCRNDQISALLTLTSLQGTHLWPRCCAHIQMTRCPCSCGFDVKCNSISALKSYKHHDPSLPPHSPLTRRWPAAAVRCGQLITAAEATHGSGTTLTMNPNEARRGFCQEALSWRWGPVTCVNEIKLVSLLWDKTERNEEKRLPEMLCHLPNTPVLHSTTAKITPVGSVSSQNSLPVSPPSSPSPPQTEAILKTLQGLHAWSPRRLGVGWKDGVEAVCGSLKGSLQSGGRRLGYDFASATELHNDTSIMLWHGSKRRNFSLSITVISVHRRRCLCYVLLWVAS